MTMRTKSSTVTRTRRRLTAKRRRPVLNLHRAATLHKAAHLGQPERVPVQDAAGVVVAADAVGRELRLLVVTAAGIAKLLATF